MNITDKFIKGHRSRTQNYFKNLKCELEGDSWSGLRADTAKGNLYIYDIIGWPWVTALDVLELVDKLEGDEINLHINSPGGDVFEGFTIFNNLRNHPKKVNTFIDGIAASAASYLALAGDKVTIAENAMFMIHDPWTVSIGNSGDLRKDADLLDKVKGSIIATYATRSGIDKDQVAKDMEAETYYSATEAVEAGFADKVGSKNDLETDPENILNFKRDAEDPEGKGIEGKQGPVGSPGTQQILSASVMRRQQAILQLKPHLDKQS